MLNGTCNLHMIDDLTYEILGWTQFSNNTKFKSPNNSHQQWGWHCIHMSRLWVMYPTRSPQQNGDGQAMLTIYSHCSRYPCGPWVSNCLKTRNDSTNIYKPCRGSHIPSCLRRRMTKCSWILMNICTVWTVLSLLRRWHEWFPTFLWQQIP